MTAKLFWEDPYLTQLDTRVAGVEGDDVTVEQTIFYAASGGQESDEGWIGTRRVVAAVNRGREIVYTLDSGDAFEPGARVRMAIDWGRRYRLMRLHSAAEIVLELMYRSLGPVEKIGAHIAPEKARIDFRWGENISGVLPAVRDEALRIIESDREITSAFGDRAAEERYWEIGGFARVPCGGTHPRRTGEIGRLELKRQNIGKGKERVDIYVADDPA